MRKSPIHKYTDHVPGVVQAIGVPVLVILSLIVWLVIPRYWIDKIINSCRILSKRA